MLTNLGHRPRYEINAIYLFLNELITGHLMP